MIVSSIKLENRTAFTPILLDFSVFVGGDPPDEFVLASKSEKPPASHKDRGEYLVDSSGTILGFSFVIIGYIDAGKLLCASV